MNAISPLTGQKSQLSSDPSVKADSCEVAMAEVAMAEVAMAEVAMAEVAMAEVAMAEVAMAEVAMAEVAKIQKENRVLQKKLQRSESDRIRLEEVNRNRASLLKKVIAELQGSQSVLEKKSCDLEQALDELNRMQSQLVESEKLAALGRLVAGVAHEINTPIGTGITLASTLADETHQFQTAIEQGTLKRSLLNHYVAIATESSQLILSNLKRAADLIHSFKQVAVDQARLELQTFDIRAYLEDVMISLSPQLRQCGHTWRITGEKSIVITSYPGVLAQILVNLVTNSLTHAYKPDESGHLTLHCTIEGEQLLLDYCDDGCGIPVEHQAKVFDLFFTTARDRGGTGLGLPIIYNLVSRNLKGEIMVDNKPGKGVRVRIRLPTMQPLSSATVDCISRFRLDDLC
jgi:two-component system, NtrC family, sensor kinase